MRDRHIDRRCELWGIWRVTGGCSPSVAPWARMRNGTPMSNEEHDLPELHLEERETAELIALMPADMQAFLCAVYPWRSRIASLLGLNRQTFNERLSVVHRMLRRMIDQRRRGEPIDLKRPRSRPRIQMTAIRTERGRRVRVAASQVDRSG